ncbi:hypothetical protein ACIQV3_11375 [Streptomyces sp. NPDC099050]|uniref:hypothetical protein n=1 Tax=Streptomyces sp. NPDC099050 TaxID=3366100 RepID=UPI003819DBDC
MAPIGNVTTRAGLVAGTDPFAATGAGNMQVQVGTGRAVVQGSMAQGAYPVAVTSAVTLNVTEGHAQFARIDQIVLRVYDSQHDTSGQTAALLEILPGTPASSPVAAALPEGAIRLWLITVPAGTSAGSGGLNWSTALTDRRSYTSAYGGIIPRGFGLVFDGTYPGQYRDTGTALERWSGTAWQAYPPAEAVETTTTGTTSATGWAVIAFAARRKSGICSFTLTVQRTGSDIPVAPDGQLADELMCRIPTGWRPQAATEVQASDGFGHGAVQVQTDGQFLLRSWSGGGLLTAGRAIVISACYVL